MELKKINDIIQNYENKSNKDLFECEKILAKEFNETKNIILKLTEHLENIENAYNNITNEINKRKK